MISVVIPTYNEEKQIAETIKKIITYCRRKKYVYEIIIADGKSSDNTVHETEKFSHDNVIVLRETKRKSKGYSIRRGVLFTKYNLVLISDADLSTPIEEVEKFFAVRRCDIVIASRALKQSTIVVSQPVHRTYSGKIFNLFVRVILGLKIKDTQCGFKLFKRDAALRLFRKQRIEGFAFDAEILYLAKKYRYRVFEVPVMWSNRKQTKVNFFSDSILMFFDLLNIRYNDLKGCYD